MKKRSLVWQTAILSVANFLVRAMGFAMRIMFSRWMGAQAVGLMELASGAHMLLITPVTSGVPMAVSRMVAQNTDMRQKRGILRCAMKFSFLFSMAISVCVLPFLPAISRFLGDVRTFPALLVALPCVPILALSAALNGYHYGCGSTLAPALSELFEQIVRFAITVLLLMGFVHAPLAIRAAFPATGTLVGELIGLLLMLVVSFSALTLPAQTEKGTLGILVRLAFPMTLMRLFATAMRTVNAVMIPARLQVSGLSAVEATSQLGMLNGMVMPLIMAPSFLTGALAMVTAPAMAQRQASPYALQRLSRKTLLYTLLLCVSGAVLLFVFSDVLAVSLYRLSELAPLMRWLCPLLPILGLHQVVSAMLSGLGLQRNALYASVAGSGFSLVGVYLLCARPELRLYGCAFAMMLGQIVTLLLNLVTLRNEIRSGMPA